MKTALLWSGDNPKLADSSAEERRLAKLFASMCSELDDHRGSAGREYTCISLAGQLSGISDLHGIITYCDSHKSRWDDRLACATKASIALSKGMNFAILNAASLEPQLSTLADPLHHAITQGCAVLRGGDEYECDLRGYESSKETTHTSKGNLDRSRMASVLNAVCENLDSAESKCYRKGIAAGNDPEMIDRTKKCSDSDDWSCYFDALLDLE